MLVKVRSHESVQFSSYVSFCNVLYICNIRVIPTYRVYRLYDRLKRLTQYIVCNIGTILLKHTNTKLLIAIGGNRDILTKRCSVSCSRSLVTLQVRPASSSLQTLLPNGASNPPHRLQKPTRSSNLYMWETMAEFTLEELSHRRSTTTSLAFGLAEHTNELLVRGCSHTGPVRHAMSSFLWEKPHLTYMH